MARVVEMKMSKAQHPAILVNGMGFAHAKTPAEDRPAEISGIYETQRGGVLLMEQDGSPFALVCGNDDYGRPWRGRGFIVSAYRADDGRVRYLFSTDTRTVHRLGLSGLSYRAESDVAAAALDQARPAAARWNRAT
jgi:hypothetical protein